MFILVAKNCRLLLRMEICKLTQTCCDILYPRVVNWYKSKTCSMLLRSKSLYQQGGMLCYRLLICTYQHFCHHRLDWHHCYNHEIQFLVYLCNFFGSVEFFHWYIQTMVTNPKIYFTFKSEMIENISNLPQSHNSFCPLCPFSFAKIDIDRS